MNLSQIVNLQEYPITDNDFQQKSFQAVEDKGVLTLPGFLTDESLALIQQEGEDKQDQAYFRKQKHNVYLTPQDDQYPKDHSFNRQIESSKGCITDDQIALESPLRVLYESQEFKDFLCCVFSEDALYSYADPMSSINLKMTSVSLLEI